ncbi:hypothetical protein P8C59_001668 [Phyllachora maydis]|uniref:Translation initiation factor IF-3 n=1 Tax=Phyllachora maydis TaxID=1825666 RepID=A0AAD9HYK4_9PEZI|nr:hypothetical protein P8C59_001668 [Phyllachora maydis]
MRPCHHGAAQVRSYAENSGPRGTVWSSRGRTYGPKPPNYETPQLQKKLKGKLRDYAIPYEWVYVARGLPGLPVPERTENVLANLNLELYTVAVVRTPAGWTNEGGADGQQAGDGEDVDVDIDDEHWDSDSLHGLEQADGGGKKLPNLPVVRIFDKKAEYEAERQRAAEVQRLARNKKEIEINWAIADNDLQRALARLQEFLRRGRRVELVLVHKAKKVRHKVKQASRADCERVLRLVEEAVAEVPGAQEIKAREGDVTKAQMSLTFEGPVQLKKGKPEEVQAGEDGKKRKKGKKGGKKGKKDGEEEDEDQESEDGDDDEDDDEGQSR